MIILLIICIYLIFGVILDMYQVYYCIKKLNEKESLNFVHILFWPIESCISLVQLIKRLSNKYTDLMIDAYGDENLIEDKSKENWVVTTTEDYEEDNKAVKQLRRIPKQSRHRYFFIGMKLRMNEPTSLEAVKTRTLNNISGTNKCYNLYIRVESYSDPTTYNEAIPVKEVYLLYNSGDDNEKLEFIVEFNKKQNLCDFTAYIDEPNIKVVIFIRDLLTDNLISVINCVFEDFIRYITKDNGVLITE